MNQIGPIGRLGRWTATHFRVVLVAWLVIAVVFGVFAPRVETALSGAGWEATGSESVQARNLVDKNFQGLGSYGLMVVVHSPTKTRERPCVPFGDRGRRAHAEGESGHHVGRGAAARRRRSRATATPPSSRPAPGATPTRWSAPPTTSRARCAAPGRP